MQRWLGSTATKGDVMADTAGDTADQQHQRQQHDHPRRNPVLAAVIREGLALLNETAVQIQSSPLTRQPFLTAARNRDTDDNNDSAATSAPPKVAYLQYHIREAAHECLEEWAEQQEMSVFQKQDPLFGEWSVRGEPVEILAIQLSSSLQHADLYWTLPRSLWTTTTPSSHQNNNKNKSFFESVVDDLLELQLLLHEKWSTTYNSQQQSSYSRPAADRLATAIQQRLRRQFHRVPVIRLQPATPHLLLQALQQEHNQQQ